MHFGTDPWLGANVWPEARNYIVYIFFLDFTYL